MTPDNIINNNNLLNSKVAQTLGSRSSSNPFSGGYYTQKRKKKEEKKEEVQVEKVVELSRGFWGDILDKIILFVLTVFGKQKEWLETKNNLKKIQNRINQFETVLHDSKTSKLKMPHHRDFKV